MTEKDHYVTGIALSQFIYGARSLGLDSDRVLKSCGLGQEHLNPQARVPAYQYEMVLLQLILSHKNTCLGADIGQQIMPPLYGVLMSLALSSPSLGDALNYMARYQGLATGNSGDVQYSANGQHYQFSIAMTHRNPLVRRHVAECVMSMLCGLIRLISARESLSPLAIHFEHVPDSRSAQAYLESALACPVQWGASQTGMILDCSTHHLKIFGHGDELLQLAESQARRQLEAVHKKLTDLEKIKWHVSELMCSGAPRREIVADRLNISARTLDRRLAASGLTWQEMIDGLRLKVALDALSDPVITINALADKLGFSDTRTFQKSFKRWTGLSPSDYRKMI